MQAARFDQITTGLAEADTSGSDDSGGATRRALLGGLAGIVGGLLANRETSARKRRGRGKGRKCKKNQTRCQKKCVNTNTDRKHCGSCGNQCAGGEQCLNGVCFSDDTCPFAQEACPNFRECGAEDSDCYCGTTTGGESVCFQDENFCEIPRPCQNTSDCADGRVCVDTSLCCAGYQLPDQPRSCLLPCETLTAAAALSESESGRKRHRSGNGPGNTDR